MARGVISKVLAGIAMFTVMVAAAPRHEVRAAEVIKIGTIFPKGSPWGKVFETWSKAVTEKSGGNLELQLFYNQSQGDEAAIVGKIKSGQLDGGFVTGTGLGKIYKPILALQMPGLFASWAKLDQARNAVKSEFEKGAKDAGFLIAGWGDVGVVRVLSKGFGIPVPTDLKGKKPFQWRDDSIQPVIFQVIGGIAPVPLNIPEVLPNLNTGAINALFAPALMAEQLQWTGKLDNVLNHGTSYAIGAIVFSSKRFDALPEDLRFILNDTAKVAASALTTRIRSEDDAAFGRLKTKMTVITPTAEQQAAWTQSYSMVRQRLAQGTFAPELVARLEELAK